jgi:hypothetical protein
MNIQTSQLVLRTCDLNSTNNPNGNRGSINTGKFNMTWNNINLRLLLGSLYEQYDLFNLILTNIASGESEADFIDGTDTGVLDSNNICINIDGLPFINQSYDIYKGQRASSVLTTYQIASSYYSNQSYFDNNLLTFSKNQEMCNLNIFYTTVSKNSVPIVTGCNYPDTIFLFKIVGIPKEEGNKNGTRMF